MADESLAVETRTQSACGGSRCARGGSSPSSLATVAASFAARALGMLDRLARPGAARRGARILDAGGRSRRPAAAALRHAGRPLAAAGDARRRRSALSRRCCSPTRTSASASITASIRWRSARAVSQFVAQRPHRLRRLDPHHAGGAAARAARRAHPRRQAAPDGARGRARARARPRTRSWRSISASRPMAAISKACARPRSPISARSRAG